MFFHGFKQGLNYFYHTELNISNSRYLSGKCMSKGEDIRLEEDAINPSNQ